MGVPQARWMVYVMENTTRMDDLGVPAFQETSILLSNASKKSNFNNFAQVKKSCSKRTLELKIIKKKIQMGVS